jgi:hypothetical protein
MTSGIRDYTNDLAGVGGSLEMRRWPMASDPGQNSFAMAWLTMITSRFASAATNARPRSNGIVGLRWRRSRSPWLATLREYGYA